MAKTPAEVEKEFIDGLKTNTGKDLQEWMSVIKDCGIEKRNDIIKWLKSEHNFGQMNASLIMSIYYNNGKPVYGNEKELLDNQLAKYENMRPLYNDLHKSILNWDNSINFIIKKTYISIVKKREFAAINIKKDELRVGMDLGEKPFDGYISKSKLTGPMARISHMVCIRTNDEINEQFFELMNEAKQRNS